MPPAARRAHTGKPTVSGASVDPAIISSQLARPDKPVAETPKAASSPPKPARTEVSTPPTTDESSFTATPEPKPQVAAVPSSSRNASPQVKPDGVPNATATVERDVATAFKGFAAQQRKNVEISRVTRARNDKEIKLNDLKNFANSFKLHTPVPSDLVSIIAKDPKKQKEIQEKAQRNAEEASKASSADTAKTASVSSEARPAQRPTASTHGSSSSNVPSRQSNARNAGFQGSFRGPSQLQQPQSPQQNRTAGNLGARLRMIEQNKHSQMPLNSVPIQEARPPPTGPASSVDPNFSRRSSGVTSAQGARLNPNSNEFRPSPHAATFSPNGNPSTGSSPKSAVNAVAPAPVSRSLIRHKPVQESERPSIGSKFDALEYIKTLKPQQGRDWKATGGLKPAYDTPPIWKQGGAPDEKPDSLIKLTYTQLFEMAPFPAQTMSPPNPSTAFPQVPHQHQLPIHLQQGAHNMGARQSPRQPPMGLHGNQHPHGPTPPFNGHDEHRMMPSHSAQSFASPRLQNVPMAYPSPMNQSAQMAYNPGMMQYPGAPPMQAQMRSFSQNQQFIPQQGPMGPIMMQNPTGTFLTSQGMAPGPQVMYPQPFMPGNGHPPPMPGVNGYPSPGRSAPMMINQGSQHGHQQPMYGMSPGMSPGPQFGGPMYQQQQQPVQSEFFDQRTQSRSLTQKQVPMRGFGGPNQFGTSPQQVHQFGPQQNRHNHPNGNYNNNKNFQHQHQNGPANNQIPTGPQSRGPEANEETK